MATLTAQQFSVQWQDGISERTVLIAVKNVNAADVLDLTGVLSQVKRAVMVGTTVVGSATATVSGTTITMPAGLANDSAFILAFGDAF